MNYEKFKTIVFISCICLLSLFLGIQSIADNLAIRRADTTIDSLERELDSLRTELEASRRTITECRREVTSIADGIGNDTTELQDVIRQLKKVREGIENMENAFNFFYDIYGDNDFNLDNTGGEIE